MNGAKMRRVRLDLGYTLAYVAERTGYTTSFISQIERNLRVPSLAALRTIANCLRCSVLWFVMDGDSGAAVTDPEGDAKDRYIMRAGKRRVIAMPELDVKFEILTPPRGTGGSGPQIIGMYLVLKPGQRVTEKMIVHEDIDESVFLIQGAMKAWIGKATYRLNPGDNLYIPAGTSHNFINSGTQDLIALIHSLSSSIA